jgi:hypothetical protein
LSPIQRSKKAISLSARISGWAPRIIASTVEPLCPDPTMKTNRRGNLLAVEGDFSIAQLERCIETTTLPALVPGSLRTRAASSQRGCCSLGRLRAKSKSAGLPTPNLVR